MFEVYPSWWIVWHKISKQNIDTYISSYIG